MLYKNLIETLVSYVIASNLLISSTYPNHFLNAINGIGLFTLLTSITLYATTLLTFFLFYRNRSIFKIAILIYSLYLIDYIQIRSPYILNNSIPNTGLLNVLNQYHPPLLFYFIINNSYTFLLKKPKITGTGTLVISLLLSMWWACQELFWGSYWNWDPVELTLLLLFITNASIIHSQKSYYFVSFLKRIKANLWFLVLITCYVINRSPVAHSVHKFVNTFFSKIDLPIFYALIYITLFVINLFLVYFFKKIKTPVNRNLTNILLPTSILIINCIIIRPNVILGFSEKSLFKYIIISLYVLYKVYFNRSIANTIMDLITFFKKIRVKVYHILPIIIVYTAIMFNEPALTTLYTCKFTKQGYFTSINDIYMELSTNSSNQIFLDRNFYKNCNKNYTYLYKNNSSSFSLDIYKKSNNDCSFFVINSCNIHKFLWIFLVFKY